MADSVHKSDVSKIQLPELAITEDRGLDLCKEPFPVLASISDSSYYKNDRTAVDGKFDSIDVYLEDESGNEELAPGTAVNYPNQSDAVGFIVDWRQYTETVDNVFRLKSGCYKIKVYYDIAGITGYFYFGSYRLLPYTVQNAEGTSRIFVVLNGYVRETDIDYKDSGFATTFRFRGRFGDRQPNYDMEDITEISRVTYTVRNESINTYVLKSEPLLSCFTEKIDANHLLVASQIFISDHSTYAHKQYYDQPVILDKEKSPEFEYDGMGVYAKITAYFKEKVKKRESKYSGDINGSTNAILDLPTGTQAEGCLPATNNIYQSDGTTLIESVEIISGGTENTNIADSVITVNTAAFTNLPATDPLDVPVHDSAGSDVGTVNAGVVDISDTTITLNTNEVTDYVLAEGSKNYNLVDPDGNALVIDSYVGDDVTIFLYWFQIAVLLFRNRMIAESATFESPEQKTDNLIELGETDYDNAIFVLTPSGYKESNLYSIKPNNGTADFTVVRASSKTRFNESGLIETVANNVPAINWVDGVPYLSAEEQATNLVPYSEPTQVSEVNTAVNISFSLFSWDIGLTDSVFFDTNTANRATYVGTTSSGMSYTFISFIEMTDGSEPQLFGLDASPDFGIRLGNGSVGDGTYEKYNIPNTNIWIIKFFGVASGTATNNGLIKLSSYSAKTFESIGYQLYLGNVDIRNSYIPTSGATATRLKDDITLATAGLGLTTITEYYESGATNVISSIPATYEITSESIKRVVGE